MDCLNHAHVHAYCACAALTPHSASAAPDFRCPRATATRRLRGCLFGHRRHHCRRLLRQPCYHYFRSHRRRRSHLRCRLCSRCRQRGSHRRRRWARGWRGWCRWCEHRRGRSGSLVGGDEGDHHGRQGARIQRGGAFRRQWLVDRAHAAGGLHQAQARDRGARNARGGHPQFPTSETGHECERGERGEMGEGEARDG